MKQYYEVVSVEDEVFTELGKEFCVIEKGFGFSTRVRYNGNNGGQTDQQFRNLLLHSNVTHWLRPVTGTLMSKEEGEKIKEALSDLIYTASKLWDKVKPIKDSDIMTATHPIIEEAKQALNQLK